MRVGTGFPALPRSEETLPRPHLCASLTSPCPRPPLHPLPYVQIRQMVEFIKLEAEEKANEIRMKVGAAFAEVLLKGSRHLAVERAHWSCAGMSVAWLGHVRAASRSHLRSQNPLTLMGKRGHTSCHTALTLFDPLFPHPNLGYCRQRQMLTWRGKWQC